MSVNVPTNVHDINGARKALNRVRVCLEEASTRLDALEAGSAIPAGGLSEIRCEAFLKATTGTYQVRLFDLTDNLPVSGSDIQVTATSFAVERSNPITLTSNHDYRFQEIDTVSNGGEIKRLTLVAIAI